MRREHSASRDLCFRVSLQWEGLMNVVKPRLIAPAILLALIITVLVSTACVAVVQEPIWPTYHRDPQRGGANNDSKDIANPSNLNLIWAFPRAGANLIDDEKSIIDDGDSEFLGSPSWLTNPIASNDAWGDSFFATPAVAEGTAGTPRRAEWGLPQSFFGRYQIMIWVPSEEATGLTHTRNAEYTVTDDSGPTTFVFDQSQGGKWVLLTNRTFSFTTGGGKVVLTDRTGDTAQAILDDDIRVIADAVKFIPATGQEIYSSPASAEITYTWLDSAGQTQTATSPAVYVGTVDPPLAGTEAGSDSGTVYCVNSVTFKKSLDDIKIENPDEYSKWYSAAEKLGTSIWHYPNKAPDKRKPWEGPIEGGIYASPTLAISGDPEKLICVVSAMDRQTYAFDAITGELLWKGPGVTKGETVGAWGARLLRDDAFGGSYEHKECVDSTGTASTITWQILPSDVTNARVSGAEGHSYDLMVWIPALRGGDKSRNQHAVYKIKNGSGTVDDTVIVNQGDLSNQGRWVRLGSYFLDPNDGNLEVTLSNVTRLTDQQIADSVLPSSFVTVADAIMAVPESIGPFGYSTPAADVVGIQSVPSDGSGRAVANNFYAMSANGRVIRFSALRSGAFDPDGVTAPIGSVRWIYPSIRGKKQVTGEADADQSELGETSASPTYNDGKLYVATYAGTIRCLGGLISDAPSVDWVYPDDNNDSETAPQFTSSPTYYKSGIFIGATDGVFYCFDAANGSIKWQYPNTDSAGTLDATPPGAFRFSTAATAYDSQNNMDRVWVGSSDGRVYSFNALNGQRLWVEFDDDGSIVEKHGGVYYAEPSLLSPVQASVALDSGDTKSRYMYVGDMSGTLHWRNAENGTTTGGSGGTTTDWAYEGWKTEGELFASPNVTNFQVGSSNIGVSYVYVAGSDGRVYAFSDEGGAWGGSWSGGDWPFEGQPNSNTNRQESVSPDTEVQFDIFNTEFWDATSSFNPGVLKDGGRYVMPSGLVGLLNESMIAPPSTLGLSGKSDTEVDKLLTRLACARRDGNLAGGANGQTNRMAGDPLYFEWGEKINMIVWNLPGRDRIHGVSEAAKRSSIKFYMTNASGGTSSGTRIQADVRSAITEYTLLDQATREVDSAGVASYDPLEYTDGKEIKRCYAVAQIDIKPNVQRPPSPGPGWILTCEIQLKTGTATGSTITRTIPLAKLRTGTAVDGKVVLEPVIAQLDAESGGKSNFYTYKEQPVGINNPLAIRDDSVAGTSLAWPLNASFTGAMERSNPEAHFNGNSYSSGGRYGGKRPVVDLGFVGHGTPSREAALYVLDRSATGTRVTKAGVPPETDAIQRFRVNSADLRWRGDLAAIQTMIGSVPLGAKFPWELGIGSVDYPNIYRPRQSYRVTSTDKDPSVDSSTLLAAIPDTNANDYENCLLQPDRLAISVDVPRFQPANATQGYTKTMEAFVDSDGDQQFDSGDVVVGRPAVYQEAYRRFRLVLKVPPDPRMEVEEQLIDLGRAPHGLGFEMGEFSPFNPDPNIQKWFRTVTVKNAGNVNLYNIRFHKDLALVSDQTDPNVVLPGIAITGTFDAKAPEPFTTSGYGYTLTKARVGDPDPTVMVVPDQRKWDADYANTRSQATSLLSEFDPDNPKPLPTKVSLRIPVSQPIGTYRSLWKIWDNNFTPYVPVFANLNGAAGYDPRVHPYADPGFQLKVTVKESQLTGDVFPVSLPQIDVPDSAGIVRLPRVGDSTPTAYRDVVTGRVHLFWSSNRMVSSDMYPDWSDPVANAAAIAEFANAPWFIWRAELGWAMEGVPIKGWQAVGQSPARRWWDVPAATQFVPADQWPDGPTVLEYGGAGSGLKSVRHHSPFIAENHDVPLDAEDGRTWLAWAGAADVKGSSSKLDQESRIFYTDITGGLSSGPDSSGNQSQPKIWNLRQDPFIAKRSPAMAVYHDHVIDKDRMWMFWQAGEKGRWSIYYSNNDAVGHSTADWNEDMQLRTPDCLASVSSPNPVHRRLWAELDGDEPDYTAARDLLDVVYSGVSKISQTPDICLSRYAAVTQQDMRTAGLTLEPLPGRRAQPMPRVFGEKLKRDPKYGFYTSEHLAWVRLNVGGQIPTIDKRGLYDLADPLADLPYIWVRLSEGYTGLPAGTLVSATDGSIVDLDGNVIAPHPDSAGVVPEVDAATGIYTYKYKDPRVSEILGQTLVDYSAGVVRFTKPLKEVKIDDRLSVTEVFADYTPQTWRLTTDLAVDNSPRAFIERTPMNPTGNPGLCEEWRDKPLKPVDRLWVIWRKAGPGVDASTIYYKTYRIGVDLSRLVDNSGNPARPIGWGDFPADMVSGNFGPWEVDRTGTRIYFSQVDERYRSLFKAGSSQIMGPMASLPSKALTLTYNNDKGAEQTVTLHDVSWIPELAEQSLTGYSAEGSINEGSIWAFADPDPKVEVSAGTWEPIRSSKIWVFWTSTRAGNSDLFWETISPRFAAK